MRALVGPALVSILLQAVTGALAQSAGTAAPLAGRPAPAFHRPGSRLLVVGACGDFATFAAAIDAARDGDVILLNAGSSLVGVVDGKSLTVMGPPQMRLRVTLTIRNVPRGGAVVVRGLDFFYAVLESSPGTILFEDCTFDSILLPIGCDEVGLSRCTLDGIPSVWGAPARPALIIRDSTVFAFESTFTGGAGGPAIINDNYCDSGICSSTMGTAGATAISVEGGSRLYLSNCLAIGGLGGAGAIYYGDCSDCPSSESGGPNGRSVDLAAGTELFNVHSVNTFFIGGSGTVHDFPDRLPGGFAVGALGVTGEQIPVHVSGPAGWNAFMTYSTALDPEYVSQRVGYSIVDPQSPQIFLGTIPASGTLDRTIPAATLEPFEDAGILYTQVKLYDPDAGVATQGTPSVFLETRRPPCVVVPLSGGR